MRKREKLIFIWWRRVFAFPPAERWRVRRFAKAALRRRRRETSRFERSTVVRKLIEAAGNGRTRAGYKIARVRLEQAEHVVPATRRGES